MTDMATKYKAEAIAADDVAAWADLPALRIESCGDHVADNNARASFGARAAAAYANMCGVNEAETVIADLLGDLRHLCDAIDIDFETVLGRSEVFHQEEIRGEL